MKKKVGLVILDGWGFGKKDSSAGIHLAKPPIFDSLIEKHPKSSLISYGE